MWRLAHRFLIVLSVAGLHAAAEPLPQSLYVWQRAWGPAVAIGVQRMADLAASYQILAGEIRLDHNDRLVVRPVQPDWAALAAAGRPVHAVLRADSRVVRTFDQPAARADFIRQLLAWQAQVSAAAAAARVVPAGFQLDLDCPTSRLGDYAALLGELRPQLAPGQLSITSLPAWLGSPALPALLAPLDFHVLQVHSLEKPTTIDDRPTLFRRDRLRPWCDAAGRLGKPFLIALPTYAYRLYFDAAGKFRALSAEGAPANQQPGDRVYLLLADPDVLADTVADLQQAPPPGCAGLVWFRLPVDTDRLNWSWHALRAVMAGRAPIRRFTAEFRRAGPGLFDLWVVNAGERNLPGASLTVEFGLPPGQLQALDLLGSSRLLDSPAAGPIRIHTPAPALEQPRRVAWLRLAGDLPPSISSTAISP